MGKVFSKPPISEWAKNNLNIHTYGEWLCFDGRFAIYRPSTRYSPGRKTGHWVISTPVESKTRDKDEALLLSVGLDPFQTRFPTRKEAYEALSLALGEEVK